MSLGIFHKGIKFSGYISSSTVYYYCMEGNFREALIKFIKKIKVS